MDQCRVKAMLAKVLENERAMVSLSQRVARLQEAARIRQSKYALVTEAVDREVVNRGVDAELYPDHEWLQGASESAPWVIRGVLMRLVNEYREAQRDAALSERGQLAMFQELDDVRGIRNRSRHNKRTECCQRK
ncbi:Aste57867_24210 [Aphanomyces stellatus]|uniref:Aste57867_14064 protein n=1 Tax=Aphanomyces stellatus TaxID=120398 RepID=A0A485L1Z3_9STRA|nr:hypothetical protein As57867_024135 [Aphanomyces stellatus]KAF0695099.1 hypothetical protein As57867_014013 [Aphanomyces stellatus]VFT90892.1 Aste57867_14064 [Aphanomyces stellatus]VFU00852.1 Aste57867_24210 [Aphanomyces stellatus]